MPNSSNLAPRKKNLKSSHLSPGAGALHRNLLLGIGDLRLQNAVDCSSSLRVALNKSWPPGMKSAWLDLVWKAVPFDDTLKAGVRKCGTLLVNAFNQGIASYSRIGGAASLALLIGLILFSFQAAAEVYPISGVWTAIDTEFPAAANETCLAVKTFGVEAVSRKSVSAMIIFAKDKRYDVRGDIQTETTIKSIKVTNGGFRITETFSTRGRWLGFKRKNNYFLNVIDPQTIEIRDATGMTRYAKCGPQKPPI
jgi:hypothetical protein